jgi:hypothetical protein
MSTPPVRSKASLICLVLLPACDRRNDEEVIGEMMRLALTLEPAAAQRSLSVGNQRRPVAHIAAYTMQEMMNRPITMRNTSPMTMPMAG